MPPGLALYVDSRGPNLGFHASMKTTYRVVCLPGSYVVCRLNDYLHPALQGPPQP